MDSALQDALAQALRRARSAAVREPLVCFERDPRVDHLYVAGAEAARDMPPDAVLCSAIATAINAALQATERPRPLASLGVRERSQRLVASRSRPQLLRPDRDRWDDRKREGTVGFSPPVRPEDPSEELAADFFDKATGWSPNAPPRAVSELVCTTEEVHALPERELEAETIAHYATKIAMLARHRRERPVAEMGSNERQLLANVDAIAALGGGCVRNLVEWWRADDAEDAWRTWAAVFALASFDGTDALEAITHVLAELPGDAGAHATAAAEALLVAPSPYVTQLARELVASPSPIARAVGVEALGRTGALSPEEIERHLGDPNAPVLRAAIRAARALPTDAGTPRLLPYLLHSDTSVASLAVRQLARWGRPEPYFAIKNGRLGALGAAALDVLILFGQASDLDSFDRLLAEIAPSPRVLSAVARFGHPRAWAYLVHHLESPELVDAAVRALTLLFGPCVDSRNARSGAAWRGALERMRFEESERYRAGEPWRLRTVAVDCLLGDMPRAELEAQLDELAVRTGLSIDVDLARWSTDTRPVLEQTMKKFERADAGFRPGSWDCQGVDGSTSAPAPRPALASVRAEVRDPPPTPHAAQPAPQSASPFDRPAETVESNLTSFPLSPRPPAPAAGAPAPVSSAGVPELTLEEYATLTAELLAHGARRVYPKYGLEDASVRQLVLDGWAKRLAADAEMRTRWDALYMAAVKRLGLG